MSYKLIVWLLAVSGGLAAATVEGTVKDPSQAAVPGATVSLKDNATAEAKTAQTTAQGRFQFAGIVPATYDLTVSHAGFDPATQKIEVTGEDLNLSIELKISAQETIMEVTIQRSPRANSDASYLNLRRAMPGHPFRISHLVLKRDAGTFTFESGSFSFLPAILGRVAAGVFTGDGTFHLDASMPLDRSYLKSISGAESVDEPFRSVVLWFTDDTYEEIKRQAQATDEPSQGDAAWQEYHNRTRHSTDTPRSMLEYMLRSEDVKNQEAEVLGELYNPNEAGPFRAYMHGDKHSDLRFLIDRRGALPFLPSPEEVALIDLDPAGKQDGIWYLSHFAAEWKTGQASSMENRHTVAAEHYRIETAIGKNARLAAHCVLRFKALIPGVRVIKLGLLPALRVVRVTYKDREIPFIQESRRGDGSFYVIMPDALSAGQSYEIGMEYEGDRVVYDAGGGNFFVQSRTSWYPSLNAFLDRATYDLTFKVPKQFTLVSVGRLEKEWQEDQYAASHWVSDVPMAVAGFNYGTYKKKSVFDNETKYQIEAFATRDVPDYLRQVNPNLSPSAMAESTMVDAQNAIRCFEAWFGAAPYGRIAITQQPEFNFGQSWPTLVYLPISAFLDSTQRWMMMGRSSFRFAEFIQEVTPHEVSHQWWGHMVGWASYHDQWLSEGFADFSAGLFLQQTDPKSGKYVDYWKRARQTILEKNNFGVRPNDAGPIWMGLRLDTYKSEGAYNRLVYPKGGYILHMLRYLMQDRQTGDKDFIDMMHDFVKTYLNKNASTEAFQSIVEKHMKPAIDLGRNGKMDWFFREWVYGTEVPSYRMDYSLAPEADGKVLFTGTVTQSGVSPAFVMSMPVYLDFDGHAVRMGTVSLQGNMTSNEIKVKLPKKPKHVLLNANQDVLAVDVVAKEK